MSEPDVTGIIVGALILAAERVTGDDPQEKKLRRAELQEAARAVERGHDAPDAARLRELLGDPDARDLRKALDSWDSARN